MRENNQKHYGSPVIACNSDEQTKPILRKKTRNERAHKLHKMNNKTMSSRMYMKIGNKEESEGKSLTLVKHSINKDMHVQEATNKTQKWRD